MTGLYSKESKTVINFRLPSLLVKVKNYLEEEKSLAYLVGGYVRDTILQRNTADVDIAVTGNALPLAQRMSVVLKGKYILLDQKNNVARIIFHEQDKPYCLDISTMRGSIEEDLSFRDFTIDAMAIQIDKLSKEITTKDIIDPYKGQNDLKNKTIRIVSKNSLYDDPIRMLRAIRLAAELGFIIDKDTEYLITEQCHLLTKVAMERVNEELCHLFSLPDTSFWLRKLEHLQLLDILIPELSKTKGVEQPVEHYWDVYGHLIETVAAAENLFSFDYDKRQYNNPISHIPLSDELRQYFEQQVGTSLQRKDLIKIAALLHDIAKPQTKIIAENGRTRFFGHDKDSAQIAAQILTRLRFSNRQIHTIQRIIELHMRVGQMAQPGGLPTHRAIYRYFRDAGDVAIDTLFFSLADHLAARGPNLDLQHWIEHTNIVKYTLSVHHDKNEVVRPSKLLDGCDLMNVFGLQPGPEIGRILETIREMQAMDEITTRDDALAAVKNLVTVNGE